MVALGSGLRVCTQGMCGELTLHQCSNDMHNAGGSLHAIITAMITSIPLTKDRPLLEFMEAVFNHYPLAIDLAYFLPWPPPTALPALASFSVQ